MSAFGIVCVIAAWSIAVATWGGPLFLRFMDWWVERAERDPYFCREYALPKTYCRACHRPRAEHGRWRRMWCWTGDRGEP